MSLSKLALGLTGLASHAVNGVQSITVVGPLISESTGGGRLVAPVLALAAWSIVMEAWMYAGRVPHLLKLEKEGVKLDMRQPASERLKILGELTPPLIRWKADNYNHLHEQPTVFYAVALAGAVMGEGTDANVRMAWAYVLLRVAHSLYQSLVNKIPIRFAIFSASSITLAALIINLLRAARRFY
jgi:hypothetical protein